MKNSEEQTIQSIQSKLDEYIVNIFKLPICYNNKVKKLNTNIGLDLELYRLNESCANNDNNDKPIYNYIFNPQLTFSNLIMKQMSSHYTTDIHFLKNTQKLIKNISTSKIDDIYNKNNINKYDIKDIINLWEEIKNDTGFCDKYLYVDWNFAKFLNNNKTFLQLMSIYNITSPVLSLCLPIFILIFPFISIKLQGIELTMNEYINVLKTILAQQSIVKMFTDFNHVDIKQKLYLLLSSAFYIFSIYQNILVCVRFYSNMKKIHDYLFKFKQYLLFSIDSMNYYLSKSSKYKTYNNFNIELEKQLNMLIQIYNEINNISPFKISLTKFNEIGHIMATFYSLYENTDYNYAISYSFGFNSYFDLLYGIKTNINNGKINKTTYSKCHIKPKFKNMFYPKFINENNTIVNNCDLEKNIIISGPNASGKTTILKTTLINILLSQQVGYGCFNKFKLTPFDNIHCYLNIPDTSGRDSLFQAEARRCKSILDSINNNIDETHFCIFDELYSGTNPEEAVISAFAFIEYISKYTNVSYLLTTHYLNLCKKLDRNSNIKNLHMKTIEDSKNDFIYTYLLSKGISNIKGGVKVLNDMNYPSEIIEITNKILQKNNKI
jgi:hypothetical protein